MTDSAKDCGICLDTFTDKTRKKICCPYCSDKGYAYCKVCIEKYLLEDNSTQPRCPNIDCRLGWSDEFLSDNMTKTYLLNKYKKHREKILLDLERARLPETQEAAARYKQAKQMVEPIKQQINAISSEVKALPQSIAFQEAQTQFYGRTAFTTSEGRKSAYDNLILASNVWRQTVVPYNAQIRRLTTAEYEQNLRIVHKYGSIVQRQETVGPKSVWTFVMKCPGTGCEGFVGTNWKCGLCSMDTCKDCREPLPHECDPDKILTAKALQKEAKPCPKCAVQISKIDGCDQMWCTQCKTAFSWRTGEIETNHVHNPHYFEWIRRNGGAPAPARQEEGECLTPNEIIDHVVHYNRNHRELINWSRIMRHFQFELRRRQQQVQVMNNEEKYHNLRVQRLMSEITDDQWKVALQRIEKAMQKLQRINQVIELYCQAGVDLLRNAILESSDKDAICFQLTELRNYCNDQLQKVRIRYNNDVPDLNIVGIYV